MKGLFAFILLLGGLIYVRNTFQNVVTKATASGSPDCLVLTGSTTREENGITRIVGTLRNDCKRRYNNVMVEFLLDRSAAGATLPGFGATGQTAERPAPGSLMDTPTLITASVSDLDPGETAEVTTLPVGRGVSYRVGKISGF